MCDDAGKAKVGWFLIKAAEIKCKPFKNNDV